MVPIRLGSVAILNMMRSAGLNDTLTALILIYVVARPADVDLHIERVHPANPQGLARRRALRRCAGKPASFLEVIAPLLAPRHCDCRRLHHRADLETTFGFR